MGWDAWSDRDLVFGFISGVLEGRSAGDLTEDEREAIEDAVERIKQRQPFRDTTFSRRTVNDALRARECQKVGGNQAASCSAFSAAASLFFSPGYHCSR